MAGIVDFIELPVVVAGNRVERHIFAASSIRRISRHSKNPQDSSITLDGNGIMVVAVDYDALKKALMVRSLG